MKESKDRNVRGWFSFSRHKSKCRILLTPCSPPPPLHPLYSLVTPDTDSSTETSEWRWEDEGMRSRKTSRGSGCRQLGIGARFHAGFELMVCRASAMLVLCWQCARAAASASVVVVPANQGWVPFKPRSGCSAAAERHLANPKGLPFH